MRTFRYRHLCLSLFLFTTFASIVHSAAHNPAAIARPQQTTQSVSTCGQAATATSITGGSAINVFVPSDGTPVAELNTTFFPGESERLFDPQVTPLNFPFDSKEYGRIDRQITSWSAYEYVETQASGINKCGVNVSLSRVSGPAGTVVNVTGTGWPYPGGEIEMCTWQCGFTITVDNNGGFNTTFTVPADAFLGENTITFDSIMSPAHFAVNFYSFTVTPPDTSIPGGLWILPDHNFKVTQNSLHFEARAYDNPGGSGIEKVNFTANVSGGWMIACTATAPLHDDVYGCDWSLVDSSGRYIPNGPLEVSFDVYDKAGNYNLAPHGTRHGEKQVLIPDLGFRPNPNGYSFQNLRLVPDRNDIGKITEPELRAMFKQLFGSQNVQAPAGSPCKEAEWFFRTTYMYIADGWSCFGMSVTSLLSYLNWSQQRAGPYAIAHFARLFDQPPTQSLLDHKYSIAYYSRLQVSAATFDGKDAQAQACKSNTDSPIAQIKRGIESHQPVVMDLWSPVGAHTILPYRVEDISPAEANVYIYDSEDPGHQHLVSFKRLEAQSTWQWEYTFLGSLGGYPPQHGGCDNIFLYPLVRALEQAKLPFPLCSPLTTVSSQDTVSAQTQRILTLLPPEGDGFMTNGVGQRLGWINGQSVSEIPDAYEVPQVQGSDKLAYRAFYLPEAAYTVQAQTTSSTSPNITLFGGGVMINLDGQVRAAGTSVGIQTTSGLDRATLSNLGILSSFNLMFDRELADGSHFVTMRTTSFTGTNNLEAQFDGNALTLSPGEGSLEYHVQLGHINQSEGIFISKTLSIGPNETYILKPADWGNLNDTTATLEIDRGSDGTVDETQTLTNQVLRVYLPVTAR